MQPYKKRRRREVGKVMDVPKTIITILALLLLLCPMANAADWNLVKRDGAEGTLLKSYNSFRLAKTNACGTMELCWSEPFELKANTIYTFYIEYQSSDVSVSNTLFLATTRQPDHPVTAEYIPGDFYSFTANVLPRNSTSGVWHRRIRKVIYTRDTTVYLRLVFFGNPATVNFSYPQIFLGGMNRLGEKFKPYPLAYSQEEIDSKLKNSPAKTASVIQKNGRMMIEINGAPTAPVVYKGLTIADKFRGNDYTSFGNMGINLVERRITVGATDPERADGCIWLGKGKYNFKPIDDSIIDVLRRNPDASIILDLNILPYKAWGKENPLEVVRNSEGVRAYGPVEWMSTYAADADVVDRPGSGKWWYPSWQSEAWRKDLEELCTKIALHVKSSPYGKAVAGFNLSGRDDAQFITHYIDYSEPSKRAFIEFLKGKYGSIGKLNSVWNTSLASFKDVSMPKDERTMQYTHRTPGPLPDYKYFREKETWKVRERLAGALKKSIGRPVVVFSYSAPYNSAFSDCKYMDCVGVIPDYPNRNVGYVTAHQPVSTSEIGEKLLFAELDLRSQTGIGYPSDITFREWLPLPESAEQWIDMHRKLVGISLANGYGWWYLDMGQYYRDPFVRQGIMAAKQLADKLYKRKKSNFRPDVCVVITDEERGYYANTSISLTDALHFQIQGMEYTSSGVPFEKHYLSQILSRPDLQDFKVYIFSQNTYISGKERAMIKEKLARDGKTLIWVYNSGLISEAGISEAGMTDLTGMSIKRYPGVTRRTLNLLPGHPLTEGCKPFAGAGMMYLSIFGFQGIENFYIDDPRAIPLARYAETEDTAMAVKYHPTWTSVYIGAAGGLSGSVLNRIARNAGAFVAAESGQQLNMSGDFASVHGLAEGDYKLSAPQGKSKVIDADTGRVLSANGSYTWEVVPGRTYWFLFE
jgi:hypothetical protein